MQNIQVVIPFKLDGAKSRLSPLLSLEERVGLAQTMLKDVISTVSSAGPVIILFRSGHNHCQMPDAKIIECDLDLNDALNNLIDNWQEKGWPAHLLIAMADLPLIDERDVEGMIHTEGDVVIAPGRGGGTNLLLIRNPSFRVSYHGLSFSKHVDLAEKLGLSVGVYYSYRCGCDMDEISDLVEVLLHGHGLTKEWLDEMGFILSAGEGRAGFIRKKGR
jgi:2-phospho-L-lactate guanylyltransferase